MKQEGSLKKGMFSFFLTSAQPNGSSIEIGGASYLNTTQLIDNKEQLPTVKWFSNLFYAQEWQL
jgi:hypothetical protein